MKIAAEDPLLSCHSFRGGNVQLRNRGSVIKFNMIRFHGFEPGIPISIDSYRWPIRAGFFGICQVDDCHSSRTIVESKQDIIAAVLPACDWTDGNSVKNVARASLAMKLLCQLRVSIFKPRLKGFQQTRWIIRYLSAWVLALTPEGMRLTNSWDPLLRLFPPRQAIGLRETSELLQRPFQALLSMENESLPRW
jgi:hypothetical protein